MSHDPFVYLPRRGYRNRKRSRHITLKRVIISCAVLVISAMAVSVFMFCYTIVDMALKY